MALALVGAATLGLALGNARANQVYTEAVVAPVGPSPLSALLSPDDPVAQMVGALSGPGLLQPGPGGTTRLDLASSWTSIDHGLRYHFTLARQGRWSDGRPITTKDVAFTLAVLQSPHFPQPDLAAPWAGVSLYANSLWAGTFVLPGPSTSFPAAVEDPVLPSAHYQDTPDLYLRGGQETTAAFPPSAGPFRVVANTASQITLTRNRHYAPQPQLAGFDIQLEPNPGSVSQALDRGSADGWLVATPADLAGLPAGLSRQRITTYAFVELLFNEQSGPLASLAVRQAIAATVDRHTLLARYLSGLGSAQYGPLPDSIALSQTDSAPQDLAPAARILRRAGWRRTGVSGLWNLHGRDLRLTLDVPATDPLPTAAQGVASELDHQGFLVTIKVDPAGDFVSSTLAKESFQLALVGFDNGADPDLTSLWRSGVEPGQTLNFSQAPPDPFLNHALDALATATAPASREAAYREVSRRLQVDLPAVFLYTPVDVYVHLGSVHTPGIPASGDPWQRFRQVARWSL
ncbi:MAG: ABC transporter substrate-binding protein [Candidatus Dormibacteria bacterium]